MAFFYNLVMGKQRRQNSEKCRVLRPVCNRRRLTTEMPQRARYSFMEDTIIIKVCELKLIVSQPYTHVSASVTNVSLYLQWFFPTNTTSTGNGP
jgi:hypothetical protein